MQNFTCILKAYLYQIQAYMYPEDVDMFYKGKDKGRQPINDDPDVERVRRWELILLNL